MCSLHCVIVINIPHWLFLPKYQQFSLFEVCQMQRLANFKNDILRNHLFVHWVIATHLTIQICRTSTEVLLIDMPKWFSYNESGQSFLNCVLWSLWGRVQKRTAFEVAPGMRRQRKSTLDASPASSTPSFYQERHTFRVLCNNSFVA